MEPTVGGAGGALTPGQTEPDLEKQLEEEFFKIMMESEIMDDILEDSEE